MKIGIVLLLLGTLLSCKSQTPVGHSAMAMQPIVGAAQTEIYVPLLAGKRVGIVANQTSTVGQTHLVDTLLSLKVQVVKVFSPEHGFRGDAGAGEHIADGKDAKTGLPLISLYGKNKKPTADMLRDVDVLLFDIQDVGARFYTYISTMHYVMEAAAENNKELIILDRPNPNGHYVDGPVLEPPFKSFVGMHPIPIVHGLTMGELAQMIIGEKWISVSAQNSSPITVIACKNYDHQTRYKLPIRPSPNLTNARAIYLYPSLCWFEGTVVSVGRGTALPFEVIGFPGNTQGDYTFTPHDIAHVASDPPHENVLCTGYDLSKLDIDSLENTTQLNVQWLIDMYHGYSREKPFFQSPEFFDKLCGTASIRKMVLAGASADSIRTSWSSGIAEYKNMRKHYLLYPDFE